MKVALVGCGAIGSFIARALARGGINAELEYVCDIEEERASSLGEEVGASVADLEGILNSEVELIVEAASIGAAREVMNKALPGGKDILILSVGALAEEEFLNLAEESEGRVYIPSGAVGGLDVLKAAREAEIEKVTLSTTKPPEALEGAPGVEDVNLEGIEEKTLLFEGTAREAIRAFPQNVNVAVAVSLAGLGVDRTEVRVYADPGAERNSHKLRARGEFGKMVLEVENLPSPQNPRTSYLAALSALATLRRGVSSLRVGT